MALSSRILLNTDRWLVPFSIASSLVLSSLSLSISCTNTCTTFHPLTGLLPRGSSGISRTQLTMAYFSPKALFTCRPSATRTGLVVRMIAAPLLALGCSLVYVSSPRVPRNRPWYLAPALKPNIGLSPSPLLSFFGCGCSSWNLASNCIKLPHYGVTMSVHWPLLLIRFTTPTPSTSRWTIILYGKMLSMATFFSNSSPLLIRLLTSSPKDCPLLGLLNSSPSSWSLSFRFACGGMLVYTHHPSSIWKAFPMQHLPTRQVLHVQPPMHETRASIHYSSKAVNLASRSSQLPTSYKKGKHHSSIRKVVQL
jgi:hypothetical protein